MPHQASGLGTPSGRLCPAPRLPAWVLRDLSWCRWLQQAPKSQAASQRAKGQPWDARGILTGSNPDELPGLNLQPQPSLSQPLPAGRQPGDPRVTFPILSGCWLFPSWVTIWGGPGAIPGFGIPQRHVPPPSPPHARAARAASKEQGSAENNT